MGARDLISELAAAGVSVAAEGDRLVIRPASKLTEGQRAALRLAKPALLALLAPIQPVTAPMAPANGEPWDDATCTRFSARVVLFMRRGLTAGDADDLAEHLVMLDRDRCGLRLCLECRHLAGHPSCGWRCQVPKRAERWTPILSCDLVHQPQRCPAFQENLT